MRSAMLISAAALVLACGGGDDSNAGARDGGAPEAGRDATLGDGGAPAPDASDASVEATADAGGRPDASLDSAALDSPADAPADAGAEASDAATDGATGCTIDGGPYLADAITVTVANGFACAIRLDKSLVCWGYDSLGQIGVDPNLAYPGSPTPLTVAFPADAGAVYVRAVGGGAGSTCAIDTTDRVW